jgi:cytochrome oxidase Cu insertion factor (SCO1/SenC/PrrC family)
VFVAAGLYLSGFKWRPERTTQHGELYQPARPLANVGFSLPGEPAKRPVLRGKWTLMYVGTGACDAGCRQALVEMRQVRRALGRDMDRVQRLYVVTAGEPDTAYFTAEHPGLGVTTAADDVATLTREIEPRGANEIFLADPLGNLVLRYAPGAGMKGMHSDLKHLLKISTIG